MRTTLLRAITSDGLKLQGLLDEPDTPTPTAVLHVHGLGGNFTRNPQLDVLARVFTDAGIAFLRINTRGHDVVADIPVLAPAGQPQSRPAGAAYERFADSVHDLAAWLDVLAERGFGDIHLQGHSLGGSKATYYAATPADARLRSLILLSATEMIQFAEGQADHGRRSAEAMALVAAGKDAELLDGPVWNFGFSFSAGTYLDLTTRGAAIDVFSGYDEEAPATLGRVALPILVVMGTRDEGLPLTGRTAAEYLALLRRKSTSSPHVEAFELDDDHGYSSAASDVAARVVQWVTARHSQG